ncbi:hypothetical protein MHYP_G00349520 [Metynnis hypsauchen]
MSLGGIDTIAQTNGHEVSAASLLRHRGPLLRGPHYSLIKGGGASGFPSMDLSRKRHRLPQSRFQGTWALLRFTKSVFIYRGGAEILSQRSVTDALRSNSAALVRKHSGGSSSAALCAGDAPKAALTALSHINVRSKGSNAGKSFTQQRRHICRADKSSCREDWKSCSPETQCVCFTAFIRG